ncbi:unnamed protein product [Phytophthora lilii]|uniref:Unnamed protein product n=1 Tax=Phytophthora lilii TaxID=2077276 RepID=A0A9W6WRR6_9STRA|nr:unnamed protein product [Phytophthora lilii]
MELKVTPICGRDYAALDQGCTIVKKNLFGEGGGAFPSSRGICWNPLTRCLLVCDTAKCCVHAYRATFNPDETGQLQMSFNCEADRSANLNVIGSRGSAPGQFLCPVAVAVNLRGDIAVADAKLNRVQVFAGSGDLEHVLGRPGTARGEFRGISDLKFTPRGYLAIVDSNNHRIQVLTFTGIVVQIVGRFGWRLGELMNPCALAISGNGDLFVCDEGNKRIQRFSPEGKPLLEWGSRRGPTPDLTTAALQDGMDFSDLRPEIYSMFDIPCDIVIGLHGEVIVCDAGRCELLVFSDVGACLHAVHSPQFSHSTSPVAMTVCSNILAVVGSSPHDNVEKANKLCNCLLAAFPPEKRVRVGKFECLPVPCAVSVACYFSYSDMLRLRLVSRFFHRLCLQLRNQWKFYPLIAGQPTGTKYNRIVSPATGLVAVEEAFEKWGLRIFKPSNRVRKHVMDFQSGFCSALSSLYGPLFCYRHEEVLRAFFTFYASKTPESSHEKEEIDKTTFIEIVTQIEEVRSGFRTWEQCTPFARGSPNAILLPTIRSANNVPRVSSGTPLLNTLRLVENAQQHQLSKLLRKFQTL